MKCHQPKCDNTAHFRYTWPGKDEERICIFCGDKLLKIANAIGCYVQFIPLTVEEMIEGYTGEESE